MGHGSLRRTIPTAAIIWPDQQVVRTADIRFVIDQLARPEALSPLLRGGRIDSSKVAVIGHSLGGAASAAALSEDPRVVAAANIDGTPYGDLPDRRLTRPFLFLQATLQSPHGDLFINGNGKLLATMTAPGFRYEIERADLQLHRCALFPGAARPLAAGADDGWRPRARGHPAGDGRHPGGVHLRPAYRRVRRQNEPRQPPVIPKCWGAQ